MIAMPRTIKESYLLRWYAALAFIETTCALVAMALIPSDAKNAWIFGYSRERAVLLFLGSIFALVIAWFAVKIWRDSTGAGARFSLGLKNTLWSGRVILVSGGMIVLGAFVAFAALDYFSHNLWQAYLIRLIPYAILGVVLGIQTWCFLYFFSGEAFVRGGKNASVPLAILLIGLVTAGRLALLAPEYDRLNLEPDVQSYRVIANEMAHMYDTGVREPVWIWIVKIATIIAGDQDATFRYLGIALFLLSGVLLYHLVVGIFRDPYLALITAAIFLWNNFLIKMALGGLRDNLFMLAVIGFVFLLFSKQPNWTDYTRIIGITFFFVLAVGTRLTSFISLSLILIYGVTRSKMSISYLLAPFFVASLVIVPYLVYSHQEYGDPLYSSNIHAVWWRNYEFGVLMDGCDGCPTEEEFLLDSYAGEPTTVWDYVFGMHTIKELVSGGLKGFHALYLSPSATFSSTLCVRNQNCDIVFGFSLYILGATVLLFNQERYLLLIPLIVTNLLLYFVGEMPYRLFTPNTPFISLFTANGILFVVRAFRAHSRKIF